MFFYKAVRVFLIAWWIMHRVKGINLPPSPDDSEIFRRCSRDLDNDTHCDFTGIETLITINEILQDPYTIYIENAKSLEIRERICRNVEFENTTVHLNGSSACPLIKMEFISHSKVDVVPDYLTNIGIKGNSEINSLISTSLVNAEIFDSSVNLLNIQSPDLKNVEVRNSNISRLEQIELHPQSNVYFLSSTVDESEHDPFGSYKGNLQLQDTKIINQLLPATAHVINDSPSSNSATVPWVLFGIMIVIVIGMGSCILRLKNKNRRLSQRVDNN